MVKPRLPALSAALAVALSAAGPSQAATFSAHKPCFGAFDSIALVGQGFTPSGSVAVSRGGRQLGTSVTNAVGAFAGTTPAEPIQVPERTETYVATDQTNPALSASASVGRSITSVRIRPTGGSPLRKRRIRARGFTKGKRIGVTEAYERATTLWAHITRRGRLSNRRVGTLTGPCGTLSVTKRLFRRVRFGTYRVQFDTTRRYKKATVANRPQAVIFRVKIFRTFRRSSASAASTASVGPSTAAARERWQRMR
jgi:hypothetical protein